MSLKRNSTNFPFQSEASIVQLSNSFTDLVGEAKFRCDDEDRLNVEILLDCIHKYLHCIIKYAEGGNAIARSGTLLTLCNRIKVSCYV